MMSELRYAYGYIRVSTHDQEEISPDSQEGESSPGVCYQEQYCNP